MRTARVGLPLTPPTPFPWLGKMCFGMGIASVAAEILDTETPRL